MRTFLTNLVNVVLLSLLLNSSCKNVEDIKIVEDRVVSASLDRVIINDTTKSFVDTIAVDLNFDNAIDYEFIYANNALASVSPFYFYCIAHGENEVLHNSLPTSVNYVLAMRQGDPFIGRWGEQYGELVSEIVPPIWEGSGPNYMGYRIHANNKYYVGWLKMEIGKKGCKIILYDMGFRLDNSNSMRAGER